MHAPFLAALLALAVSPDAGLESPPEDRGATLTAPADVPAADQSLPAATEAPPLSWMERFVTNTAPVGLALHAEIGFVGVLAHTIQFSRDGTEINYLSDAAQNTLFPFLRFSADVNFLKRNTVVLLYQPLELATSQLLRRDLTVDGEVFKAGTGVDFLYGFSFWRLSYLYNFFWDHPGQELAVGVSLQIRNARITFASRDGTKFRSNENIGPVPVLKLRGRYTFDSKLWVGAEVDGFYAGTPGFNGSDNQFIGAILDGSVRVGVEVTPSIDAFLNFRTIWGGAIGVEKNPPPPSDGYVNNWLYTMSLSLGFSLKAPGRS